MTHIRLNHPTRPTLAFKQSVQDDYQRQAVANITREITPEPPLVHTETRDNRRNIRGEVSAPKQSRDTGTSDWQQALADYADQLEAHVDPYQGDPGYTLEDDQLGITRTGALESVEWTMRPGRIYEIEYDASFVVGTGTMEARSINRRNPVPDQSMGVMLRVDGIDCPGMREYRSSVEIGLEVNATFNRTSAEDNQLVPEENGGRLQQFRFTGVHSGTLMQRRAADSTLSDHLATQDNVTLETAFPGYDVDGFVTGYNSDFEDQRANESHRYELEFTVGTRA